jgi:hypothetical protein
MAIKTPSSDLTKKFIEGLENYGLTYEEIENSKWKYCGGNKGRHLKYYKLCYPTGDLPQQTNECICGHHIDENCYITDEESLLILGNCCIKKFIKKSSRSCDDCGNPHKNRKINKCNNCRMGICEKCGIRCDYRYKKCYKCVFK